MAQIASGNPGWLLVDDEQQPLDVARLDVADIRHGPQTVASVVLYLAGDRQAEAGSEMTLTDVLATIKGLESIARQAINDGYGITQPITDLREDELPTAAPFDSYEIEECGEVNDGDQIIVERLNDSAEYDDHDRTFWTLYGRRDNEGVTALFDADTLDEVREIAALVATTQPVYLVVDGSWIQINPGAE